MSIWERYDSSQQNMYLHYLKAYGALSGLFKQKAGHMIPYLDSKFQETIYAKSFESENVDIGNTPHDILSIFGNERVGIGIKTWMNSTPSYQKVMQLKRYKSEIEPLFTSSKFEDAATKISNLKNEKMLSDYSRLGLSEDKNIYHYVTRDKGKFLLQESAYPLINTNNLRNFSFSGTSLSWDDGLKEYKYTLGDSQIWQKFSNTYNDTAILEQVNIEIIEDPFTFLTKAYDEFFDKYSIIEDNIYEIFLPLYSYQTGEVQEKSGLNAWNAASKNKGSSTLRPLNEIYIPIPRVFHKKFPDFFTHNIFGFEKRQQLYSGSKENKPQIRFHLQLPNGQKIPALVTQENMKALQSGSRTERRSDGTLYGQSDLGQWLLINVLQLNERTLVTREWLQKKGTDSVRLWRDKKDYSIIHIDFAPVGSFEKFMKEEEINEDDNLV